MAEVGGVELSITTKVDNKLETIIGQLDDISHSLGKVTDNMSSLTKVSEQAANSLSTIANAVKGIDASNISKVSSAINNIGAAAKSASTSVEEMAKSFAGRLGITAKKEVDQVVEAFRNYYSAYKDIVNASKDGITGEEFKKVQQNAAGAARALSEVVNNYARIQGELNEVQQATLEAFNAANRSSKGIKIEEDIINSFPIEKYQQLRAMMGQGFGVSKDGIAFSQWLEQLVSNIPGLLSEINALFTATESGYDRIDVFEKLAEYVSEARNNVYSLSDAIQNNLVPPNLVGEWMDAYVQNLLEMEKETERLTSQNSTLAQSVGEVANSTAQMGADLNTEGIQEVFLGILKTAKEVEKAVESIAKEAEKIEEPLKQAATNSEGLQEALDGVKGKTEETAQSVDKISQSTEKASESLNDWWEKFKDTHAWAVLYDLDKELKDITDDTERAVAEMAAYKKIIRGIETKKMDFDADAYKRAREGLPKAKDILGYGKQDKKDDTLKWMASIIALQHELEKVSSLFGRMGDIAKNAFLKALTPLKLIQHEFEEMKSNIIRVGSGFAMVSKWILKVYSGFDGLRKKIQQTFSVKAIFGKFISGATKAFNELSKRWKKVAERFSFTLLRKAINSVINQLNDAIKSLALFSSEIGTNFNGSMSIVTSDVRYLAASIIALLEPLINYFTPILDGLVDQLVNVVNHVNMFVAALTGAKSFTIAKKKIIDYSKALDKANKSAKMLTLGIDELNILNDDKSAEELEDLFDWQELPTPQIDFGFLDGEIVDLIKRIIQQIKELLKAIINAIKEAWRRVADYVLSALKRLVKAILTLFSDILRDLTKLFNEEATIKLFETIFRIIGDIANVLATIVEKIDEAWNYNNLGLKILEKIRDILLVIVTHVQHVTEYMKEWAERLSFIPLFEAFLQLLTQVEYAVDQIGYVFEDLSKLILDLMEYVLEKALPEIIRFQGDIVEGIGNIAKNIHEAWTELDYGTTLFNDITAIVDTLLEHIRNVGEEFKSWTVELDFKPVMKSFDGILQSIEPLTDALGNVFEDMFSTVLLPLVQYVLEEAAPKIMDVIADIIKGFANLTDGIHSAWQELSFGEKVVKGVSDIVNTLLDYLEKAGQAFKRWAAEVDFKPLMKGFDELLKAMQPVADFVGGTLSHVFEAFLKYVQYLVEEIFPEWEEAIAHIANATDWKNLEDIFNSLVDAGEHLSEAIGGGVVKAVENLGVAVGRFTSSKAFNDFIENLTNFVNRIDGDMVAKVLTAIGEAILKIAEAVMNFANSKLVQDFLNSLLDFVNNSSTQKLANILLDIAKAFLAFKGLSAVAEGLSSVISIIPGLVELGKILSPTGALIVGIGAAVAAFALFGDTIRSIDWSKLARDLTEGFLGLLESIDWDGIGKTFGYLFAELIEFAITTSLNPAFQLRVGMTILQALVGAISGIIQGLGEAIAQFFEEIGLDIVAGLVRGIANGIAGIFDFLRGIFQGIIDFVKEIFGIQSPSTVFAEIGVNLVLGLIQGITETWGLILEFFATAWQGILDWFSTTWENFKIWVSKTWAGIVQAVVDAWNGFVGKIQAVWDIVSGWFATKWDEFKTWAKKTWDKIIDTICSVWHDFIGKVGEIWNEILTWFDTIWSNFTQWVSKTWDKITSAAADVWNFFTEKVGAIWDKIKKWFEDTWNKFKEWVAEIWRKIVQAAIDAWRNFIGDIQAVWAEIKKWFSNTWNKFKEWVGQIWDEIVGTIIEAWRGFIGKISAVWDEIKKWFSDTWDAFKKWVSDKWNEIIGAIIHIWNDFVKEISGIWDEVTTFFKTLWDDIKGIWEKVWGDIIGGVKAVWDKFKQDIKRIWDNITGSIKDIWDDVSKAWKKVWEDIGGFIKDIANGIVGTVEGVINTVIRGVNKLIDLLNNLSIDIPDNPLTGAFTLGFNIPKIPELNIPRFATGGFPEDGLFMANHNELVGQFGNRNAVVNNQQIEAGIAQAVSSAMVPYLEQIAQNTRETADKDMTLNIDSREVARANTTGSRNLGRPLTSLN